MRKRRNPIVPESTFLFDNMELVLLWAIATAETSVNAAELHKAVNLVSKASSANHVDLAVLYPFLKKLVSKGAVKTDNSQGLRKTKFSLGASGHKDLHDLLAQFEAFPKILKKVLG